MRFLILIFITFFSTQIAAQNPIFNQVNFSKNYVFTSIDQDDYGFLWLGCSTGLVFYNGYEDYLLEPNLINSPIHVIQIQNDTLFAGDEKGVIYRVDLRNRHLIDSISLNISSRISDVLVKDENVYISTYGDGVFDYNKISGEINTLEVALSSNHVYEIIEVNNGNFAIASDRGIDIYNPSKTTALTLSDLPDIIITNLVFESPNTLWASSYDQSIFSINLTDYSIQNFPFNKSQKVNDFIIHKGENLMCSADGVFYLNHDGTWDNYLGQENASGYNTIMVDHENNLWIAGKKNPLWKASLYFGILNDINIKDIQALGFNFNQLLIGNKEGLFSLNLSNGNQRKILDNNITCISTFKNLTCVGTFSKGIYILGNQNKILGSFNKEDGLIDNSVLDVAFLDEQTILVSSLSGSMKITFKSSFNKLSAKSTSILHENLGYSYIMDIATTNNTIYLGKDKAGFSTINNNILKSYNYLADGISKLGSINSIAESDDASIWLSSSKLGLLKFEGDSLRRIESIQFDDEAYTSLIPIPKNHLLLIRASSIDLFDVDKEHVMYFNEEAGLISKEPFINNYAYGDDEVWFVHHDKIYSFQPPSDNQKIHPTTSIDLVEVNLESIGQSKSTFKQSENNFKFTYTGGWLTDPSKLSYSYFLEGFDEQWRETRDRSVSYPHLPPGNYVFHVKAAENEHFSDEPINTYSFKIKQSFYNSGWFYIILLFFIGLIIRFLIKRDQLAKDLKAQFLQKQVETQLINLKAQLNPHFLFNSFNTLSGLIEINPDRGISYIENITDFYRNILELGDQELIPLSKELELVRLYEKLLKERFGNGFVLSENIINQNVLIPPMTIQMLIENAIKHNQLSKKTPLRIEILQNDLQIIVSNNKAPKNMSVPSTGLGLKNIQDRYRLLGFKDVIIKETRNQFSVYLPNFKNSNNESTNS